MHRAGGRLMSAPGVDHHLRRRPEGPRLFGVVHLGPLPGSPRAAASLDEVVARAGADARTLRDAGADGLVVENFGDAPFCKDQVPAWTIAAMTVAALAVREAAPDLTIGINVLRNDGLAALGVAAAVGAAFVRVNVLTGAAVTDQGVIEGRARDLALARRLLDAPVAVAADVHVKHAMPLAGGSLQTAARDTWHRGGADALIVTGSGTGAPTAVEDLRSVAQACPDAPLWLGSGLTPDTAPAVKELLDVAIVGTWLHAEGHLGAPLDPTRIAAMRSALQHA